MRIKPTNNNNKFLFNLQTLRTTNSRLNTFQQYNASANLITSNNKDETTNDNCIKNIQQKITVTKLKMKSQHENPITRLKNTKFQHQKTQVIFRHHRTKIIITLTSNLKTPILILNCCLLTQYFDKKPEQSKKRI